jgi:hypothetical protein
VPGFKNLKRKSNDPFFTRNEVFETDPAERAKLALTA